MSDTKEAAELATSFEFDEEKISKLEKVGKQLDEKYKQLAENKEEIIEYSNNVPKDATAEVLKTAESYIRCINIFLNALFIMIKGLSMEYIRLLPDEMRRTKRKLVDLLDKAISTWRVGLHLPKEKNEIEEFIRKHLNRSNKKNAL